MRSVRGFCEWYPFLSRCALPVLKYAFVWPLRMPLAPRELAQKLVRLDERLSGTTGAPPS